MQPFLLKRFFLKFKPNFYSDLLSIEDRKFIIILKKIKNNKKGYSENTFNELKTYISYLEYRPEYYDTYHPNFFKYFKILEEVFVRNIYDCIIGKRTMFIY